MNEKVDEKTTEVKAVKKLAHEAAKKVADLQKAVSKLVRGAPMQRNAESG